MVESQGKVSEKSGNFEMDIEWQPCLRTGSFIYKIDKMFWSVPLHQGEKRYEVRTQLGNMFHHVSMLFRYQ